MLRPAPQGNPQERAGRPGLGNRGVTVEFRPLPVGDCVVSRRIAVERKR